VTIPTITLNGAFADTGYVDIPVSDGTTLVGTKRFSFTKAKQGASYRNLGEWNSTTNYVCDNQYIDVVTYMGSSYNCKASNINKVPAIETSYWTLLSSKGDDGVDANLLSWVADWNSNMTNINGTSVISPKMFAGTKNGYGQITGIAIGRDVLGNGINGIAGYSNQYPSTASPNFKFGVDGTFEIGSLSNQKISLSADGTLSIGSGIKVEWNQVNGTPNVTNIDSNGRYTGTIYCDQITTPTGHNPIIKLFASTGEAAIDATANFNSGVGHEIRMKWDNSVYMVVGRMDNGSGSYTTPYADIVLDGVACQFRTNGIYFNGSLIGGSSANIVPVFG
jgi:hypothetical protein